jgi:DnaJ-class molecular chaperone
MNTLKSLIKPHLLLLPTRSFRTSRVLLFPRKGSSVKDFYSELNLESTASHEEIKQAYFKLAKQFHPDINPSAEAKEKFGRINQAYETLSDKEKRRAYDQTGATADDQYDPD